MNFLFWEKKCKLRPFDSQAVKGGQLLKLPFTSIFEYLQVLCE